MKNIFKLSLILLTVFITSCDKDEFAELNSKPSELSKAELRYSVTRSVEKMFENDYTIWFYNNFDYAFPWGQLTGVGTGNDEQFVTMGPSGSQSRGLYLGVIPNTLDIRNTIDNLLDAETATTMQAMRAMTYAIQIQPAITITDNTGSMVYSEAGMAAYTTPVLLTPKFETQAELFDIWLGELDEAIIGLTKENQFNIGSNDVIYGGDYVKWAKFCNLLKLKIAARLVNTDRSKAIAIAEEVAASSVGYMSDISDDFIYKRDIQYFGTGNGTQPGGAGKNVIDFLVANKDPRVRFLFTKNSFNAEVVQQFITEGVNLPPYVAANVTLDGNGDFLEWAGAGEPWVRYYGAPLSPDAENDTDNDIYFRQAILNKVVIGGTEKTYGSTSNYSERLTRTEMNFTFPTKIGRLLEVKDNYPGLNVILGSAAETNLYLAEFKMLGANLPGSAQDYFNQGVRLSVERLDALAKNNGDPYYNGDPVYAAEDNNQLAGATMLVAGEIDDLLAMPSCDLSVDGLEKIYIQQYINFAGTPGDFFTTVRRSGIPKTGSTIFPREPFLASGTELTVPRRFVVAAASTGSKNYENEKIAVEEQGFTGGSNDPTILNTERLWFDITNPSYGAGPKN